MSHSTENDDQQTSLTLQRQELKPSRTKETTTIKTLERERGGGLHPLLDKNLLDGTRPNTLSILEIKVMEAATPDEAKAWLDVISKAREQERELAEQRRKESEEKERRFYRKAWFWLQPLFAIATIALGIYLTQTSTWLVGFFILGAGLSVFSPDYVKLFFKEVMHGQQSK